MAVDFEELKRENEWFQEWKAEGIEEGLQEGLKRGRNLGQRSLLELMLRHRFGTLPQWVNDRLESATGSQLEQWAEQRLDARDLESVFA